MGIANEVIEKRSFSPLLSFRAISGAILGVHDGGRWSFRVSGCLHGCGGLLPSRQACHDRGERLHLRLDHGQVGDAVLLAQCQQLLDDLVNAAEGKLR